MSAEPAVISDVELGRRAVLQPSTWLGNQCFADALEMGLSVLQASGKAMYSLQVGGHSSYKGQLATVDNSQNLQGYYNVNAELS